MRTSDDPSSGGPDAAESRGANRRPAARVGSGPTRWLLCVLAAAGLAVAQPSYDAMTRYPEFVLAHQLTGGDLLWLALLLSVGLGGLLWLPAALLGLLDRRWGRRLAHLEVAALLATPVLILMPGDAATTGLRWTVLAVASLLLVWSLETQAWLRRFLAALAVGAVAFPALFLWRSTIWEGSLREPARPGVGSRASPVRLAEDRPPIVLVVLDELPLGSLLASPDRLDGGRFPRLAGLARSSHWFAQATTVAQSTSAAIPAILTGRLPRGRAAPIAAAHPDTLFERLRGAYELNVTETMTALCGASCGAPEVGESGIRESTTGNRLRWTLEDLAAVWLASRFPALAPPVDGDWIGFWRTGPEPSGAVEGEVTSAWRQRQPAQRFERFLARVREAPRETFHYLHLSLPHVPWQYLPDGRTYARERGTRVHGLGPDGRWSDLEWEVVQAQQRHLLQLAYTDRLVGRLLDTLEEIGILDDSLIVLTADHGASFRPGDRRRILTESNLVDIVHVPLFIKLPGQRSGVIHQVPAQLIDIAPTVGSVVGLPGLPSAEGRNLLGGLPAPSRGVVYRSWYHGGAGEAWPFDWDRLAATARAVEIKNRRFPEASLYSIGRDRRLLGRESARLPRADATGRVEISRPGAAGSIDVAEGRLPVHATGRIRLSRPVSEQQRIALAVDGVVSAVTETFGRLPGRDLEFTVLFDPEMLPSGARRLEVFVVSGRDTLAPLRWHP